MDFVCETVGRLPRRGIRDVRLRWYRGDRYLWQRIVLPAKRYRKRFERFCFTIFRRILFYRRVKLIDSTKRGMLNERVIYN